ncbi:MAG: transporter [Urechidicola sp.]|nr:transporter [Urechidicola sp.]
MNPLQSETSNLVPNGSLSVELGVLYESFDHGDGDHWSTPTILIGYGLTDKIELQLSHQHEYNKVVFERVESEYFGWSDFSFGPKFQLLKKEGGKTEIALLTYAIVPTAKDELSNNELGFSSKFAISHIFSERIGLVYNLGYDYLFGLNILTNSLSLGYDLSDKLAIYGEHYGSFVEREPYENNLDIGLTYYFNPNVTLDANYGTGLNFNLHYFSMRLTWQFNNFLKSKKN